VEHLPSSLQVLILGNKFDQKITKFPLNLQKIQLSRKYINSLENIPSHVKILFE